MIEVAFVGSATGAIELVRKIASIFACRVKKSVVRALPREVKRVSKWAQPESARVERERARAHEEREREGERERERVEGGGGGQERESARARDRERERKYMDT
jgi:DNA primase large subunit